MNAEILSILRFTAAIIVILFHQKQGFEYLNDLPRILLAGPEMVTFFFVLSGFTLVIAYGHSEKLQLKKYLLKRVIKIYPLYFISLCLPVFLLIKTGEIDYLNLMVNLALIQSWIPSYPLTLNSPAWYLSDLMFCYMTFPLLLNFARKHRLNPSLFFSLSVLLWLLTQTILTVLLNSNYYQGFPSVSHDLIFYFPLSHYCSFLLGVAGAIMISEQALMKIKSQRGGWQLFVFALFLIIILVQYQDDIYEALNVRLPHSASLYAPCFLLLIGSVFFIDDNRGTEHESLKFIALFGAVSYPLYILQSPVAYLVFSMTKKYQTNAFMELVIYLIALFVVSAVFVKYLDKPLKRFLESKLSSEIAQQGAAPDGHSASLHFRY